MLVLSRLKDEAVVIGGDVRVIVNDIRGHRVRLGIDAPRRLPVHRSEVADTIDAKQPGLISSRAYDVVVAFGFHRFANNTTLLRKYFDNPCKYDDQRRRWFNSRYEEKGDNNAHNNS